MARKSILFISNGFAEDLVAATLIKELRQSNPHLFFYALPIVGDGSPYQKLGSNLIGPHWELPSQGITYGEGFDLWRELKAGAVQLYLGKIVDLIKNKGKIDLVVGVGDFLSGLISGVFIKKPFVYIWVTASHFDPVAKHFLRKYAIMIFSRWRKWGHLPEFKVEFVGNPNMDTFEISGEDFGIDRNLKTIGIFPGSRLPAYNNLPILLKIVSLILAQQKVNIIFGISPAIDREKYVSLAKQEPGWSENIVFTYKFGDVLNTADLVVGLGGACTEQATGLGKPVVTFWGGGHPREEEWVKGHANYFLKEAALVLPPQPELVADSILSLLSNPAKMKEMGEQGIELNGGQGGTKIIAGRINEWLMKN